MMLLASSCRAQERQVFGAGMKYKYSAWWQNRQVMMSFKHVSLVQSNTWQLSVKAAHRSFCQTRPSSWNSRYRDPSYIQIRLRDIKLTNCGCEASVKTTVQTFYPTSTMWWCSLKYSHVFPCFCCLVGFRKTLRWYLLPFFESHQALTLDNMIGRLQWFFPAQHQHSDIRSYQYSSLDSPMDTQSFRYSLMIAALTFNPTV